MRALVRFVLLTATIVVAVIAGSGGQWGLPVSPYFDPVFYWIGKAVGPSLAGSNTVFHAASAAITGSTLLIAALPAAILGRLMPQRARPLLTRLFWILATIVIAWPALRVAADLD